MGGVTRKGVLGGRKRICHFQGIEESKAINTTKSIRRKNPRQRKHKRMGCRNRELISGQKNVKTRRGGWENGLHVHSKARATRVSGLRQNGD